ncbi:MAG TPA: hypothetical protein VFF79_13005 [Conexibacter sp.]|jgi:hypothetical protein|nr:hypothetical protein [Conexibacter sp.]
MRDTGPLGCCHTCRMIGSEPEAAAHRIATGHDIDVLDAETSAAVRAEWAQSSARRAVSFAAYARRLPAEGGEG